MTPAGRRGFTLMETLVAVVLTVLVGMLAHQLFGAVADQTLRLRESRHELDRVSNGHRLLQSAFLSLEVGIDSAGPFSGHHDSVQFPAWMPTPDGWLERRAIRLALDGDRWSLEAPPDPDIELARGVTAVHFDYALEPGSETAWVTEWESVVSAPIAVRVRVARGERVDTTIYLIKARG